MNHFEVHLMISSRVIDFKVLRTAIQFEVFLLMKRLNGKCNVRNFRRFLFGMSPDVPVFKVSPFTSYFKFLIGVNGYYCLVPDILKFCRPFLTYIALPILQKKSICHRWILFSVSYYVNFQFTPWRVIISKIWVGMSTTSIDLLQFKIQSHLQNRRLWMLVHHNSYPRNTF